MKKIFLTYFVLFSFLNILYGCGAQGKLPKIPGVQGPFFNALNGQIIATLNLNTLNINQGFELPLPNTQSSYAQLTPNIIDGGTTLQLILNLEDLKDAHLDIADPNTLPDGRPLPGIPGGVLPSLALNLNQLFDSTIYYSPQLFGLFIPIKGLNTYGLGQYYPLTIKEKRIGILGLVASDNQGENAGLTLFLRLDLMKNRELIRILKLSKRYPRTMF